MNVNRKPALMQILFFARQKSHDKSHTHTGSDKFVPLDKVPVPYTNSESNLCLENKPQ